MYRLNLRDRMEIVERCARGENRSAIAQTINSRYLVSPNINLVHFSRVYLLFKTKGSVFNAYERAQNV